MYHQELVQTVAPCGLVCALCANSTPEKGSCLGCSNGGGPDKCHQRDCCSEKALSGCWDCNGFPCNEGFFAEIDEAWRGLCVGSVQCIKEHGLQGYVDRLMTKHGRFVEYGDYRFKSPEVIKQALCGT